MQEQEWQGTRDIAAYLATPRAIQFLHENDWARRRAECHTLARYAQEKISPQTNLVPLSDETWFAQMVSLPLPPCDAAALKTRLYDAFRIEVPILTGNEKQFVRVSVQPYNSRAEVDELTLARTTILNL